MSNINNIKAEDNNITAEDIQDLAFIPHARYETRARGKGVMLIMANDGLYAITTGKDGVEKRVKFSLEDIASQVV